MHRRFRQLLSFLIKAAISALLLYLSLRWVDTAEVASRLSRLNFGWLTATVAVVVLQISLLALRWRLIAQTAGAPMALPTALRIGFIAAFFSQTLPSTIGGDAARIWLLGRHSGNWKIATYSVLIDRAIGLFALAVIVAAFLPATFALVGDPAARAGIALIALGGIAGPIVFCAIPLLPAHWLDRFWASRHATAAARITWRLGETPGIAIPVAIMSILVHALTIVSMWTAAKSVGASLGFIAAFSIIPPVILISTIPVSIAGWGVRESAMIAAFGYAGLAHGDGLLVSLIFGAASFAVGAVGGLIWIASSERAPSADEEAALQDLR
jgi:uncharacterized membrane protein YbhN (UPF0104 family)